MSAHCVQSFCLWICDCTTNTAADNANILQTIQMSWDTQRTNNVQQVFACFHCAEHLGGTTYHLNDQGDGAFFSVIICNGQRNALALLVDAEDDELSGENLFSDKRSLYLNKDDCFVQQLFVYDFIHLQSHLSKIFDICRQKRHPFLLLKNARPFCFALLSVLQGPAACLAAALYPLNSLPRAC